MAIRVGINFKLKNTDEVFHFHKIQVRHNVLRICTLKIRERGTSRKHLVLDNKKRICNNPLDLRTWFGRGGQARDLLSIPVSSDL